MQMSWKKINSLTALAYDDPSTTLRIQDMSENRETRSRSIAKMKTSCS